MNEINWDKVIQRDEIGELSLIVATVRVFRGNGPSDLAIEVLKHLGIPGFEGRCNYSVWGPRQASPYRSVHQHDTIEDAINDALGGIEMFYDSKVPPEVMFWATRGHRMFSMTYIDGNGDVVPEDEVRRRRDEYLRANPT